ncbi:MAG: glycoside hydrolase family 3 C-terminal domain-containing protein, partial [Dehalococcoidales bacterium]|nr:glycoside hydrolase family 3 C-terminal domain-containing protein [Dehalococcoidales bacterium]
ETGKSYPVKIEYCRNPRALALMRGIRIGCTPPLPADALQRAVDAAGRSDAAVVFAGLTHEYESEGYDRPTMDLPEAQVELIRKVAEANPRTIVVLNNGAPVSVDNWISGVPAVLEAWYPGQECGNAIAAVLLGEVNPSGKLPDTFPKRYEDNPAYDNYPGSEGKVNFAEGIFVGYRYYDAQQVEPSFPFGHGLSYTDFTYANLKLSKTEKQAGEPVQISINLTNSGTCPGKEVVQVYVSDREAKLPRPPKELKAFRKVTLQPAETQTVTFTLDDEDLSYWDTETGGWVVEPGDFEVLVGSSSRDIRARASFTLTG